MAAPQNPDQPDIDFDDEPVDPVGRQAFKMVVLVFALSAVVIVPLIVLYLLSSPTLRWSAP